MDSPKVPNMMAQLIGAINKIQDIFNTLKVSNSVKLPQIVMLGSQVIVSLSIKSYFLATQMKNLQQSHVKTSIDMHLCRKILLINVYKKNKQQIL